jgi:hypothetical protein
MMAISFLDVFSPPVITCNYAAAMGRATTTTRIQYPVGLSGKQCIVHSDFFFGGDIAAGDQSHVILHPGVRVARMVHQAIQGASDRQILDQI